MSKESKESWTSKHRGPDPLKVTHKKNKIGSLVTPRRSKYVKISSEEVSDAVEKYLSGGGVITRYKYSGYIRDDRKKAKDRYSPDTDVLL